MKRKLLSLTLVLALVLSLVPMGAFAAAPGGVASVNTTNVSADKSTSTADFTWGIKTPAVGSTPAVKYTISDTFYTGTSANFTASETEFTVYAKDLSNVASSTNIVVVSSRDTEMFTTGTAINHNTDGGLVTITPDDNGKATVKVASNASGTAKIGFFVTSTGTATRSVENYRKILNGVSTTDVNSQDFKLITTKEITYTADSAGLIELTSKKGWDRKDGTVLADGAVKANNINFYEMEVKVATKAGAAVAGEKVEFSANSTNVSFDNESVTTDGAGIAKVKVYAKKAGTYDITARKGSYNLVYGTPKATGVDPAMRLVFASSGGSDLTLVTSNDAVVAVESEKKIKLRLLDGNGNQIRIRSTAGLNADVLKSTGQNDDVVKVEVVKEPSGSSLTIGPSYDNGDDTNADYTFNVSEGRYGWSFVDDYLRLVVNPKKEGDYTFKIYLDNGKKVEYRLKAVKQGDIKSINFLYAQSIVTLDSSVSIDTLERVDAAGVPKSEAKSKFYFTSSDVSVATVSSTGVVKITNDKDDIGKKVTITATDKDNKLTASHTLTVGGKLSTIKTTAPKVAEVGKDAAVDVQFVDNKGNKVAFNLGDVKKVDAYVISKPEGAIVGTEESASFLGDMESNGNATYFVSSNKPGEVKVQITLELQATSSSALQTMSDVVTLNFGSEAVVAGKTLVLNMGSMTGFMNNGAVKSDLAPFIKDGRAFVPVSFIAAQLGGTAEFTKNAAGLVDTVTVKAGKTTVTMTIGSTTIKVVKDGKESTVTSDVAPFIKSGRTVLPFRAIAEAMGAKVSFGPETGAVEWVKFEM